MASLAVVSNKEFLQVTVLIFVYVYLGTSLLRVASPAMCNRLHHPFSEFPVGVLYLCLWQYALSLKVSHKMIAQRYENKAHRKQRILDDCARQWRKEVDKLHYTC